MKHNLAQDSILLAVVMERRAQDKQWGGPEHDDEHDAHDWENFIIHQLANSMTGVTKSNGKKDLSGVYRQRMIKVAALAVAAVESYDRKHNEPTG
jgi:hypothetical protein